MAAAPMPPARPSTVFAHCPLKSPSPRRLTHHHALVAEEVFDPPAPTWEFDSWDAELELDLYQYAHLAQSDAFSISSTYSDRMSVDSQDQRPRSVESEGDEEDEVDMETWMALRMEMDRLGLTKLNGSALLPTLVKRNRDSGVEIGEIERLKADGEEELGLGCGILIAKQSRESVDAEREVVGMVVLPEVERKASVETCNAASALSVKRAPKRSLSCAFRKLGGRMRGAAGAQKGS